MSGRPQYRPWELGARCSECPLYFAGKTPVPPTGPLDADWVFVGEGPAKWEEIKGQTLCGPSGQKLNEMLWKVGRRRESVYTTNALACRAEVPGETGKRRYDMKSYMAWHRKQNVLRKREGLAQVPSPFECCLDADAVVWLSNSAGERLSGNHTKMTIREIVASRYSGYVLGIDETGHLCSGRVINWYTNKIGKRRLFDVSFVDGPRAGNGKPISTTATEDHLFLTVRGWVPAGDLRTGDAVASDEVLPSQTAMSVIIGSMLGDGSINRNHLTVSHRYDFEDYVRLKSTALTTLGVRYWRDDRPNELRPGQQRQFGLRTAESRFLGWFKSLWCKTRERKSTVPTNLNLDLLSLAVWFFDDGFMQPGAHGRGKHAEFATNCFDEAGLDVLQRELLRFELPSRRGNGRLHLRALEARRLSALLAPYAPASMQYKILREHRRETDPILYQDRSRPVSAFRYIEVHERAKGPKGAGPNTRVYCIDVDGIHNFVTTGGVVHNCLPRLRRELEILESAAVARGTGPNGLVVTPLGNFAITSVAKAVGEGRIGGGGKLGSIMKMRGSVLEVAS